METPPNPQSNIQPATPKPQPTTSNPPRLSVLWTALIMFLIGLVAGILLTLTYPKPANTTQTQQNEITAPTTIPQTQITETPEIDLSPTSSSTISAAGLDTSNWKLYKNIMHDFEFKYPEFYNILAESADKIVFGEGDIALLTILINPIEYKTYTPCNYTVELTNQDFPCLEKGEQWGQQEDIMEITLSGKKALSFYINENSGDSFQHVVQILESPKLEAKMFIGHEGLDDNFKQILSTFQFTN